MTDWGEEMSRLWFRDRALESKAAARAAVLIFGVVLFAVLWTILTNFVTPPPPSNEEEDQLPQASAYTSVEQATRKVPLIVGGERPLPFRGGGDNSHHKRA